MVGALVQDSFEYGIPKGRSVIDAFCIINTVSFCFRASA